MESHFGGNLPAWFGALGLEVNRVLFEYKAMERFREMLGQWAHSHCEESAKVNRRSAQRMEILLKEGRVCLPEHWDEECEFECPLTVADPAKARKRYFKESKASNDEEFWNWMAIHHSHFFGLIGDNESTRSFVAKIPIELAERYDPSLELPTSLEHREFTLPEKYALLSPIHDAGNPGQRRICEDYKTSSSLLLLYRSADRLIKADQEQYIRNLLRDVEADLQQIPTNTGGGRKKATFAVQQKEAELAEKWRRAKEAGTSKADFAKDKGMTFKKFDALVDRVSKRKKPLSE